MIRASESEEDEAEELHQLALRVALLDPEGDPDPDGDECLRCRETFRVPCDLEPTALCDACAQAVVQDLARELIRPKKWRARGTSRDRRRT